jgi:hypothetical protein
MKRNSGRWKYPEEHILDVHGDSLWSWFREKFPKHKDALNREECRAFVRYIVGDARGKKP